MSTLIDLRQAATATTKDVAGLRTVLRPLVGEPFAFARFSYGDELTLHFGDIRLSESKKLKDRRYGAYVLGFRASAWFIKGGADALLFVTSDDTDPFVSPFGRPLTRAAIELGEVIREGSHITSVDPFTVEPAGVIALRLATSDGGSVLILPKPDPDEATDPELPSIADWDLSTPGGLLSVGPGLDWSFQPRDPSPAPRP